MAEPVIDWAVVQSAGVQQLVDLLAANHRFRVEAAVRNNPTAVRERLEIAKRLPIADLVSLVLALDEEEQAAALDVPYLQGKNPAMDEAFGIMVQGLEERAMMGAGPSRFVAFVGMALASVAGAFGAAQSAQAQRDAEASAARTAADAAMRQQLLADAAKRSRTEGLKKAAPWIAAVVVIVILILFKL